GPPRRPATRKSTPTRWATRNGVASSAAASASNAPQRTGAPPRRCRAMSDGLLVRTTCASSGPHVRPTTRTRATVMGRQSTGRPPNGARRAAGPRPPPATAPGPGGVGRGESGGVAYPETAGEREQTGARHAGHGGHGDAARPHEGDERGDQSEREQALDETGDEGERHCDDTSQHRPGLGADAVGGEPRGGAVGRARKRGAVARRR